jgi:hypothetical protein
MPQCGQVHPVSQSPSGEKDPSEADRKLTRLIQQALSLVEIRVLDHIMVAGAERIPLPRAATCKANDTLQRSRRPGRQQVQQPGGECMKKRVFMWGWSTDPQRPDETMTSQRMVMLMRTWRRAQIAGRREFAFALTSRATCQSSYSVVHLPTGEAATFTIVTVSAGQSVAIH